MKAGVIDYLHTLESHLSIHANPSAEYAVAIYLLSFVCLLVYGHIIQAHEGCVLRQKYVFLQCSQTMKRHLLMKIMRLHSKVQ